MSFVCTRTQVFKYRKWVASPPNGVRLSPRSVAASGVGFILVIDRRLDRWAAVRATLLRIAVSVFLAMCLSQTPLIIAVALCCGVANVCLSISPCGCSRCRQPFVCVIWFSLIGAWVVCHLAQSARYLLVCPRFKLAHLLRIRWTCFLQLGDCLVYFFYLFFSHFLDVGTS